MLDGCDWWCPLLGETRTFTYTIQPRLESTCPIDFMDTGDRDFIGRRDEEAKADTVARTMDPATAPLTDDEPLNWSIWSGDNLLMTSAVEVCFNISPQISKLNCILRRRMSLQMRRRKTRLNTLNEQTKEVIFEALALPTTREYKLLLSSFTNAVSGPQEGRVQQMCGCYRNQGIYKARQDLI